MGEQAVAPFRRPPPPLATLLSVLNISNDVNRLSILLFSFLFDWHHKMVSPQNGDIHSGQARSQKFAMGGLFWGSGGGAPSRRRPMGVWGRSPQPPEAGGLGAKPPAAGGTGFWGLCSQRSKILRFFAK